MAFSIKKFYDGAEIFITGGSGFIGKALVEKLLRSCSGVKRIYLLMRPKKGATLGERLDKLTDNLLFKSLLERDPHVTDKITMIQGDVMELNLGMSEQDLEKIKSCSIIFHAAASVRFDDPLKSAILLNTRGTREVCEVAKLMPNLKSFVHVSTAYIQPKNLFVEEKIYPPDGNWRTYIEYAENLDKDLLDNLTLKLTSFAPNTYTFTKHLAEHVCIYYRSQFKLPITIYRPSIVGGAEVEPMPGWFDNFNGPMGLIFVGALGINHVINNHGGSEMNTIPIDICVKGMIIAAHETYQETFRNERKEISVYNAASVKSVRFSSITEVRETAINHPSKSIIGIPHVTFTTCSAYAWILRIFRMLIPAIIIDGLLCISGNKPKLMKIQRIIYHSDKSLQYFGRKVFKIVNYKFNDLNLMVPEQEKKDFFISETKFGNSNYYSSIYFAGLQAILKESPADLPNARRRFFYVQLVLRTVHVLVTFAALRMLKQVVLNFFN